MSNAAQPTDRMAYKSTKSAGNAAQPVRAYEKKWAHCTTPQERGGPEHKRAATKRPDSVKYTLCAVKSWLVAPT